MGLKEGKGRDVVGTLGAQEDGGRADDEAVQDESHDKHFELAERKPCRDHLRMLLDRNVYDYNKFGQSRGDRGRGAGAGGSSYNESTSARRKENEK